MCKQAEIAQYHKFINEFINESKNLIKMSELINLHQETLQTCLDNYKLYSMETSSDDYHDLESSLLNSFSNYKDICSQKNIIFIKNLKETACTEYKTQMKNVKKHLFKYLHY